MGKWQLDCSGWEQHIFIFLFSCLVYGRRVWVGREVLGGNYYSVNIIIWIHKKIIVYTLQLKVKRIIITWFLVLGVTGRIWRWSKVSFCSVSIIILGIIRVYFGSTVFRSSVGYIINPTLPVKEQTYLLNNFQVVPEISTTVFSSTGWIYFQDVIVLRLPSRLSRVIDGNYRLITLIFKTYGNLHLCFENHVLFLLPPIFTNILYTYTLRPIIYLGERLGNFTVKSPWHIYTNIHAWILSYPSKENVQNVFFMIHARKSVS